MSRVMTKFRGSSFAFITLELCSKVNAIVHTFYGSRFISEREEYHRICYESI